MVWITAMAACTRFDPVEPAPADDSGTTDTDPHTGESGETGTPPVPLSTYVYEVERRALEVPGLDLTVVTYAVTADNPLGGYRDNEGNDPRFHVVRRTTFTDPAAAHPALVW